MGASEIKFIQFHLPYYLFGSGLIRNLERNQWIYDYIIHLKRAFKMVFDIIKDSLIKH